MSTPLLTLDYTLTTADALAYEVLPREMVGWRKWAVLLWLASMGGVVALLPDEWVGPPGEWRFWIIGLALVGLAYGIATLVMTLARHRRARRRIAAPGNATLEQWGDHLVVHTAGRTINVAYESIADVSSDAAHVFITAPPEAIIVPLDAFEDAAAMAAFAADIDRLSHESAA